LSQFIYSSTSLDSDGARGTEVAGAAEGALMRSPSSHALGIAGGKTA
jgi:hypothetical protein